MRIPFPVITETARSAVPSVFEIHRLDPNSRMTINLEEFGDSYEYKVKGDRLQPREAKLILLQIQQCRDLKRLKACEFFAKTTRASGFLVDDRRTLLTTLPLEPRKSPFAIFNMKNELVYMGTAETETVRLDTITYSSQVLRIHLNSDLGPPLRPASRVAPVGTQVYAVGFPVGTGKYIHKVTFPTYGLETRNPLPESKGDGIFYSIGKILSANADGSLINDADVVAGSEGGPILNDAGEVVGIVMSGSYEHNEMGALRVRQYGLSLKAILNSENRD